MAEKRGDEGAVAFATIESDTIGLGGEGNQKSGALPDRGESFHPLVGGRASKRIGPARVKKDQMNARPSLEVEDFVEGDASGIDIEVAVHLEIDREEKIMSGDLDPVAPIVEQRNISGGGFSREGCYRSLHRVPIEIYASRDVKTQLLQLGGEVPRIVWRVVEARNRGVSAVPDDEGDPRLRVTPSSAHDQEDYSNAGERCSNQQTYSSLRPYPPTLTGYGKRFAHRRMPRREKRRPARQLEAWP